MRAFAIFLIIIGLFLFLSLTGFFNVNFSFIVEIIFAIFFCIEGIRELTKRNLIGIGGLIFSAFLFLRAFRIFGFHSKIEQAFIALIASYLIGIGFQLLFRKTISPKFWEKW